MKVTVQDELLESLAELRRALPSLRRGQMIANMATVARGPVPGAIWEMEDDELLGAIRWQLQQLSSPPAANGPQSALARTAIQTLLRRRDRLIVVPHDLHEFWAVATSRNSPFRAHRCLKEA